MNTRSDRFGGILIWDLKHAQTTTEIMKSQCPALYPLVCENLARQLGRNQSFHLCSKPWVILVA